MRRRGCLGILARKLVLAVALAATPALAQLSIDSTRNIAAAAWPKRWSAK